MVAVADLGMIRRYDCCRIPTQKTQEICTLWYRPPEILLGDANYTSKVDIWSIGCIFAELISGYPLFPGDSQIDQLFHIFRLCGTPTSDKHVSLTKLEGYKTMFPKFPGEFHDKFNSESKNYDKQAIDPAVFA